MELYLRCLCVGVLPPPYTLQGMDTWLRGIPRACVAMRPSVLCYVCDRVHVSVFAYRGCDGLAPLTIGGADQARRRGLDIHDMVPARRRSLCGMRWDLGI